MSFYKRYELVKMIREGEVKTFSGFRATTRQPIYLHLFDDAASRPSLGRLMRMVRQAEAAGQIIEAGEFGKTCFVVTDPIERFTSLLEYLEANPPTTPKMRPASAVEAPKPAATIFETWPAPPPGSARTASGTHLPAADRPSVALPLEATSPAPRAPEPPTPAAPPPLRSEPQAGPPPPPPPPQALPSFLAESVAGEATNLFGSAPADPPAPPPPVWPGSQPAAEPAGSAAPPGESYAWPVRQSEPATSAPPPTAPPGESYAWPVRRSDPAASAPPPPFAGSTQPVSDISDIFGSAPAPSAPPPPPLPAYPPSAAARAPADYMQMAAFPPPDPNTTVPPPPPPPPPAVPQAPRSRLMLVLLGGAIGTLLAVLAVYWFLIRR